MIKNYPSNVSKEQFENIRLILENSKKNKTKKFRFIWSVLCGFICIKKWLPVKNVTKKFSKMTNCILLFSSLK